MLALAAAAGIAAFFSPCSFPLAVTLLARETMPGQQGRLTRLSLWLGLGALLFLVLAGALIAAGAGSFFKQVTFTSRPGITIRAIVGSLLVLLGLIQLNVLRVSFLAVEDAAKPLMARQAHPQARPTRARVRIVRIGIPALGLRVNGPNPGRSGHACGFNRWSGRCVRGVRGRGDHSGRHVRRAVIGDRIGARAHGQAHPGALGRRQALGGAGFSLGLGLGSWSWRSGPITSRRYSRCKEGE
jgi:hypothetical protein